VLRKPSPEQEDAHRTHRRFARLMHERIAHTNRIGALLVLHNLRPKRVGGRDWSTWWASHVEQIPPALRIEIEREHEHEHERLALVKAQMNALQASQRQEIADGRLRYARSVVHRNSTQPTGLPIGSPSSWTVGFTAPAATPKGGVTPRPCGLKAPTWRPSRTGVRHW
jgi:transposase